MDTYSHHQQCLLVTRARRARAAQRWEAQQIAERRLDIIRAAMGVLFGAKHSEQEWDGTWTVVGEGPQVISGLSREEVNLLIIPRPPATEPADPDSYW